MVEHMNKVLAILLAISVSSCSMLGELPSFYDDNESKAVVDLAISIEAMDCNNSMHGLMRDVIAVRRDLRWLETYTYLKPSEDIRGLLVIMRTSVDSIIIKETTSNSYCEFKKKILIRQVNTVASTIMGRF